MPLRKQRRLKRQFVQLTNATRGTVLCPRAEVALGLRGRSRGLMTRSQMEANEGMVFRAPILQPFMWMHTLFMAFPIDIVFLNRAGAIVKINHSLKPWRFSSLVFGARWAIELTAGVTAGTNTLLGDTILLENIAPDRPPMI